MVLSDKSVGLQADGATILLLKHDNVELHPDQRLSCNLKEVTWKIFKFSFVFIHFSIVSYL